MFGSKLILTGGLTAGGASALSLSLGSAAATFARGPASAKSGRLAGQKYHAETLTPTSNNAPPISTAPIPMTTKSVVRAVIFDLASDELTRTHSMKPCASLRNIALRRFGAFPIILEFPFQFSSTSATYIQ